MATPVYLSNDPSSISGYLKAYIGGRSPNASSTVSTAVTATSVITTTTIAMTLTSGGTTAKWITEPLKAAVTISTRPFLNVWGLESSASANADIAMILCQYTTAIQTAFLTTSIGVELTTSAARQPWVTNTTLETVTSTAFAAGDRLAITPGIGAIGTMGAALTVTMDYNGSTPAADGDTFIQFNEDFQAGNSQYGDGDSQAIPGGPGAQHFYTMKDNLSALVGSPIPITNDSRVEDVLNELLYQGQQQGA